MRFPGGFACKAGLAFLVLFILAAPAGWAQRTTGTIVGTVTDPSEGAVSAAKVVARNVGTNLERSTTTNSSGFYRVELLPIGKYAITVEATGFRREVVKDIVLEIDQTARIDVRLQLGELSQQVEVTGAPPLADTSGATIADVIENNRIVNLPLNGRNFQQLALLTANVTVGQQGGTQDFFGTPSGSLGFVVSGGRDDQNNFLVDGITAIDHYFNTLTLTPNVDAIQEFKVLQNSYTAEAGMFASGQINVSTKSGTNELHGSVYEFLRNDVLDARNFFDLPGSKPPFQQNQFGLSLGGPIRRDKTFFFASYEGLRVRQGQTVLSALPTSQQRTGIFSGLQACLNDPSPTAPGGPFVCSGGPTPGTFTTTIPAGRFGPVANRIISDFFPVPNLSPGTPGLNHVSVDTRAEDRDQFLARVDHRFSDSHSIFARYIWARSDQIFPFGDNILTFDPPPPPGFGTPVPDDSQNLAGGWTYVLRLNLINEFRVGWNHYDGRRFAINDVNFATDVLGLSGPQIDRRDRGFPAFTVNGLSQFGDSDVFNPLFRENNIIQFSDNLSWTRGRHALKFGGDVHVVYFNTTSNFFTRGFPVFQTFPVTGNFIADFLIDRPFAIVRTRGDTSGRFRTNLWGIYVNDEWRASPRLTITAGLRYEIFPPIYERSNRLALYDRATQSIIIAGGQLPSEVSDPAGLAAQYNALLAAFGLPPVNYVTGSSRGLGRSLTKTDFKRVAPRLGIAYDLTGKGKTVVRAAYGIYNALRDWSAASDSRNMLPFTQQMVLVDLARFGVPIPPLSYSQMYTTVGNVPGSGIGPQVDMPIGYAQHYTLNLQHQIGSDFVVEVAYVGTTGINLNRLTTTNQERLTGPAAGTPENPQFGFFIQEASGATSSFNSGFLRVEKRLSQGLLFVSSYTYSKAIDTVSSARENGGAPTREQDSFCLKCERGRSNFDVRNRWVTSFLYDLPFGPGRRWAGQSAGFAGKLLEGWQVGGILTFQSGQPFTIQFPGGSNAGFRFPRPSQDSSGKIDPGNRTPQRWFDPTVFYAPPQVPGFTTFQRGNTGRNTLDADGLSNVDFTIQKITSIRERYQIHFRAEFFNIFNHPNFNIPDRVFVPGPTGRNVNPNLGQITSARSPRIIQFGLKFTF